VTEIETGSFKLAGYVPLNKNGFALPAFAAHPGGNAWYVATADIDGDHLATIRHFELLEDDEVVSLPNTEVEVAAGDPWQDVFLWNGRAYVGTPQQILHGIDAWRDDLEASIPISFLDLLLAAEAPVASTVSRSALAFMEKALGNLPAAACFEETVVRPGIILELRRLLHRRDPKQDLPELPQNFIITSAGPANFQVELAAGTVAVLGGEATAAELTGAIERLGNLLNISLKTVGFETGSSHQADQPAMPAETLPKPPAVNAALSGQVAEILIVASDRRAAQIARYIEPPGELVFDSDKRWDTARFRVGRTGERGGSGFANLPEIQILDRIPTEASLDRYGLIIWLAGDESLDDSSAQERMVKLAGATRQTPFLLAPVPPADAPSTLSGQNRETRHLLGGFTGVIDTTVARSPFWTGQPRRSIDRRIADIVVTIALAGTLDERLKNNLLKARGSKRTTVVTFCGSGEFTVERSTASEFNAAGLWEPSRDGRHRDHIQFGIRERSDTRLRNAFIELQPLREDFPRFARAAVAEALGPGGHWQQVEQSNQQVPAAIRQTLDHPDLACAIPSATSERRMVIVTAETPDLTSIREAARHRAAIARYTDTGTIRTFLDGSRARFDLPTEIRLPRLHRYSRNRGLATRGVDARDIVRVSANHWSEQHGAYPGSELVGQQRRYLATIGTRGIDPDVILPVPAVWSAVNAGDPLARQLVELWPSFREERTIEGKRISDLIAAWSRPARGTRRWVIEDGRIPVELSVLNLDEVPAQRLFQIDGDEAVPVFLMSRIFAVWAWALLPSSTSWASRFQVSKTFDAFPFPLSLSVQAAKGESPPQLRLGRSDRRWVDLAGQLQGGFALTKLVKERGSDELGLRRHPLIRQIDSLLLEEFELAPDATDLDILERLVARNRLHD